MPDDDEIPDAMEQFYAFLVSHHCDWEKGLRYCEQMYHRIEPETLLGRHHQIAISLNPSLKGQEEINEGFDKQLYLKARSQERLDCVLRD